MGDMTYHYIPEPNKLKYISNECAKIVHYFTDHRGNVYASVSDRPLPVDKDGDGYYDTKQGIVLEKNVYYPYGSLMQCENEGRYRFVYNGMEKDNEVLNITGSLYNYGERMYSAIVARFISPDPLIIKKQKYPELSPYQFASNTPIQAIDLEGLEALIVNERNKTITIAVNIYCVTSGTGSIAGLTPMLKKATDLYIVNQLDKSQREISVGKEKYEVTFKLNYITKDNEGNPLDFNKAIELQKKSVINYTDPTTGKNYKIKSWKTGVVVASDEARDELLDDNSQAGEFNIDYKNKTRIAFINYVDKWDPYYAIMAFVHEMGHVIGQLGHPGGFENTNPGITSTKNKNIRLVPTEINDIIQGAAKQGEKVKIK